MQQLMRIENPGPPPYYGSIGTTQIGPGSIFLDSRPTEPIKIYGDVKVGVGGNPDTDITVGSNVIIQGQKMAMTENPPALPEITATPGTLDLSYSTSGTTYLPGGNYGNLNVNRRRLIFTGTNYTFKSITMTGNSRITIQSSSSPVTIKFTGNINMSNAQFENLTRKSNYLMLYGTDSVTSIILDTNYGAYSYYGILSRNAYIDMKGGGTSNKDYFGSFACSLITTENFTSIHYDKALMNVTPPVGGGGGGGGSTTNLSIKARW